jgi:hypothetical protein
VNTSYCRERFNYYIYDNDIYTKQKGKANQPVIDEKLYPSPGIVVQGKAKKYSTRSERGVQCLHFSYREREHAACRVRHLN